MTWHIAAQYVHGEIYPAYECTELPNTERV